MTIIKAYLISVYDKFGTLVVFAESANEAKYIAQNTEWFCDDDYIEIRALRVPVMDKYYREGKQYMDWSDPKDRCILVKELDFRCEFHEDCENCSAKSLCDEYMEYIKEKHDED